VMVLIEGSCYYFPGAMIHLAELDEYGIKLNRNKKTCSFVIS